MSRSAKLVQTIGEYRLLRRKWNLEGLTVGFVPTMGALHEGHSSLIKQARKNCDIVVSSIFVNPAQFAPTEDLDKYPRTLDLDLEILKKAEADVAFCPSVSEMYPAGITLNVEQQSGTFVEVLGKSHQLEGFIRPHFFRGVATICTKLFNIIQPTHVYFGQKDVQQCSVIRTIVRDLHIPISVVVCDTIREADGLAKSSRNRYLSASERELAPILYRGMQASLIEFEKGVKDRASLIQAAEDVIKGANVELQYLSIAEPFGLNEIEQIGEQGAIMSGAIKVGKTRIIDNILLGLNKDII